MSNLINFFFSFDKLMKEKLILPFFWLLIIYFGANFLSEFFDYIWLDFLDGIIDFLNLFVGFLLIFVGGRILCELAVAIFRINDNLSPDHGVSETADIDPVAEARRAAEDAARRARLAAENAVSRTQSATRSAVDSTKATVARAADRVEDVTEDMTDAVKSRVSRTPGIGSSDLDPSDADTLGARDLADGDGFPDAATLRPAPKATARTVSGKPTPRAGSKTAAAKAATTKTAAATKTATKRGPGRPKGSKTEVRLDPVTGQRLKKDGTPYKKPGRKPGSTGKAKTKVKSKSAAKPKTSTGRGRGRPKGSKSPAIYDPVTGVRLKKDGTPYKKPGPKPKS